MANQVGRVLVMALSILAVVLVGCARRPGMMGFGVPAPTGAATALRQGPQITITTTAPPAAAPGDASGAASPASPSAGVPAAPAERPEPRDFEATANLQAIHFDFDKSDIRPGDAGILDTNARWLNANPTQLVLIEGHCDERGTNEYNLALGERRAEVSKNYLVSRGVQVSRISTLTYGEERPLCTGHDESCWSQNRRAQFLTKTTR